MGFERRDGLGANHAAIGDDADPMEQEAFPQPRDHRYQGCHVGGIARPHLATDRPPGLIDDDAKNHLMQIWAGVFGMTVAAERRSAVTLEIQARRIEDRQPHIIEEVAALGEQLFLDQILVAAGHQAAALLVGKFFAEPSHRPVQVMQVDRVHAADGIGGSPLLRGTIRARIHDPMQHGQEHGALDRKLELAVGQQVFDHRSAKAVPPKSLEEQGRADPLGVDRRGLALLEGRQQHPALGESGAGSQQPIEFAALLERVEPAQRRHHGLARLAVDPMAFHHLEVIEAARSLGAEVHAGLPFASTTRPDPLAGQVCIAGSLALRRRPIPGFATAECGFQPHFEQVTVKVRSKGFFA